jgi:hypothetical protein
MEEEGERQKVEGTAKMRRRLQTPSLANEVKQT